MQPVSTELATERLRLRLWQLTDAEKLRDLGAERDPRSLQVIDSVGRPTVDDLRTSLVRQLAETALTGLALLAIEDRDQGQFIGYCGLIVGPATWEEHLSYSAHITAVATPPKPERRS